ncbi:LysR substrate-binding domain-containing protein [Variovorax sp. J22G73]|uniref:LysR substrate-binding domain-containing protein n=1 Tax=unclassified Variovorax TaxID=663243 RepID=UPI002575DF93|nr:MULTISPECIES: LysR substrate-binding domain-containing protein [unclassified Variovorax]MDM0004748.1 LysR substrate-binding domain-containing protein [Variovorax sp. J22R203]MDM0098164.1 LysR substrate-binding domain-containing protein [Variovorax sp. J22G73]
MRAVGRRIQPDLLDPSVDDARVLTCSKLQVAEQVLAADKTEPFGRLRAHVPATFGRMRVLPLLLRFAELHPGVRPHISFADRFVDLVEEGIDVGIRIGGADTWPAALGHRFLGTERLIFCAAPSYLKRRGTPESIADLSTHDAVTYGRADGSANPWLVTHGGGPAERSFVEGRIIVCDREAQVETVLAGGGVAQLATWLVEEHLASGRLVQRLPDAAIDGLPLHLVWPRSRQLLPKVDGLLSYLGSLLEIR